MNNVLFRSQSSMVLTASGNFITSDLLFCADIREYLRLGKL